MTLEEKKIKEVLEANSVIFFKDFIDRITSRDNGEEDEISNELVILSISSLQIAMELAMKASLIEHSGLYELVFSKKDTHRSKTKQELLNQFENNSLKTLNFENVKNYVRINEVVSNLDDDDFEIINDFQKYRNGMVHFAYKFSHGDYFDLKYDIIYFAINILIKVLYNKHDDLKPSEFLEYKIGKEHYNKLKNYKPYLFAMEKLARNNSNEVLDCFFCQSHTYAKDAEYCYFCNIDYTGYQFTNCAFCKSIDTMLYDHLNLENNYFSTRGNCLVCKSDAILFACSNCDNIYNLETEDHSKICSLEKCINT